MLPSALSISQSRDGVTDDDDDGDVSWTIADQKRMRFSFARSRRQSSARGANRSDGDREIVESIGVHVRGAEHSLAFLSVEIDNER